MIFILSFEMLDIHLTLKFHEIRNIVSNALFPFPFLPFLLTLAIDSLKICADKFTVNMANHSEDIAKNQFQQQLLKQ